VVEALLHFFPASVDKLKPESSRIKGAWALLSLGQEVHAVCLKAEYMCGFALSIFRP
jgi:hypothetical protein